MRSEPGAGTSDRRIASAEPSSKSSDISVLKALTRKPMTIRLITKKTMVPLRILERCSAESRGEEVAVEIFFGMLVLAQ